ncbi:MAG TPA: hypothetical protein VMZ90_12755 [Vicinamibacterales bacterium]|nr:hypothetical protein [Vicinamibacterales bacterium]
MYSFKNWVRISSALIGLSLSRLALAQDPATQGFVRASQPQPEYQTIIQLVPVNATKAQKKKPSMLVPTPAYGPFAQGVWLPAGEYELVNVTTREGLPYPPVTVRAGEITDLGAWVRVLLGGYDAADIAIPHPVAAAELAKASSALADKLKASPPIVWSQGAPPKPFAIGGSSDTTLGLVADMLMAYNNKVNKPPLNKLLREAPTVEEMWRLARFTMKPQTDEGAVDERGNLYYGATLGQVRVRNPAGEWDVIDVGTLEHITAVEADGGRLVVGTSRGALWASDDHGAHWSRIGTLGEGDAVLDIDHAGSRWFIVGAKYTLMPPNPAGFANMRMLQEVRLYSSSNAGLTDLGVLRELARPNGAQWAGSPEMFAGTVSGRYYYVGAMKTLLKVDAESLAVTTLQPPHMVSGFSLVGSTPVITAFRLAGLGSKVSVSKDGGTTWKEYPRPSMAFYDVSFDEAGHGRASRWSVGMWKSTLEFVEWNEAAKDWKLAYTTPPGCLQVLRDETNAQKFCVTTGASILVREGDAWKAEFAVE